MDALIEFILSCNIITSKTKSNKGFMIYKPSQVTDINKLTSLANDVGWKVIQSDDEWDKGSLVRSASIYVGPVTNSYELTDKDALRAYLKSQMS